MSTPGPEPAPDPRGLAPLTWLALAVAGVAFLLPLLLVMELSGHRRRRLSRRSAGST
ncbi:hypothetical protein [Dietzia sp. 179-F 9C3 NHS]|uniref:hypothetical protein n=1 Tax=Dietzia sp. 179-F 9C3 NHS TaxID=3374295 RepID=UPI00387A7454